MAAISSAGISPRAIIVVMTPAVFKKSLLVKDIFPMAVSSESMMINALSFDFYRGMARTILSIA
jgi:hypothetical protein